MTKLFTQEHASHLITRCYLRYSLTYPHRISRVLVLIVIAGVLCACGGKSTSDSSSSETEQSSTPSPTETPDSSPAGGSTNTTPVADAGTSQYITVGTPVTLDGTGSTDAEESPLSYAWEFTSTPNGDTSQLLNAATATPSFIPSVTGDYTIQLTVHDGTTISQADTITLGPRPNTPPVANAGADADVSIGNYVHLDGTDSTDDENDALTYSWSFVSTPNGNTSTILNASSPNPSFIPSVSGNYIVQLTVNDGRVNSPADTVTFTSPTNTAPIANAGGDGDAIVDTTVNLDGTGSTDEDGNTLTYSWTFTSTPLGSTSTLLNATTATPSFTPTVIGDYTVQLIVNDGRVNSLADTATFIGPPINQPPTANAGLDQDATVGVLVSLDGSQSSDEEEDTITYLWSFAATPNGNSSLLIDSTTTTPSFTPSIEGDYYVQLIVNDGLNDSAASTIIIAASHLPNEIPIANAGTDENATVGILVNLDGSSSSDADDDTLTYLWSFTSTPNGNTSPLLDATTSTPSFTPSVLGSYVLQLIVNDGTTNSAASTITIDSFHGINYPIVDTNQKKCFDSAFGNIMPCIGTGHDADYSGNQPHYTTSPSGASVRDNITSLTWQQNTDINDDGSVDYGDKMLHADAIIYCDDLTLDSRSDWRLPSIKEAYSLILFSGKDASNYTGTDTTGLTLFLHSSFDRAFGDMTTAAGISAGDRIIDAQYASSTLYVSTTMNNDATMFGVNYVDGRIKGYPKDSKEFYVRCVADNTQYGVNKFTDNEDDTISDNATGLMWQKNDSDSTDWDAAIATCEAAETATFSDWRLPNIKELHSIVDYSKSPDTDADAAINAIFNATSITNEENITDWAYYWSSTSHMDVNGDGANATYIAFGRALGYMLDLVQDVHGAGSQRSNDKLDVSTKPGIESTTLNNGTFYYKGPQGDILRINNKVRCVRDI